MRDTYHMFSNEDRGDLKSGCKVSAAKVGRSRSVRSRIPRALAVVVKTIFNFGDLQGFKEYSIIRGSKWSALQALSSDISTPWTPPEMV